MSVIGLIAIGFVPGTVVVLGAAIILMCFHARAMEAEFEVEKLVARPRPPAAPKPADSHLSPSPPYRPAAAMAALYGHYVPNDRPGALIDARHL